MKKKDLAYSILTYVTSALSVVFAALWIALAIKTFSSPEKFTQQGALNAFLISLPVLIVFILDIISVGVYSVVRNYAIKDNVLVNEKDKYEAIINIVGRGHEKEGVLAKEKKIRNYILWGAIILAACFLGIYLSYFIKYCVKILDGAKDPTAQVIHLVLYSLPWLALALASGITGIYLRGASYKRAAKEAAKLVKGEKLPLDVKKENKVAINVARGVILAVAITFIVIGAIKGEAGDVLKKAAAICTECIGLG